MQSGHQEVLLKLQPRPLRLAYLVNTHSELVDAVTLYTHIWGGFANTIFPVPSTTEELSLLEVALYKFNPDYIFLPEETLPTEIAEVLQQFPAAQGGLLSARIQDIANLSDHLLILNINTLSRYRLYDFPHIFKVLNSVDRNPLTKSNICLIESSPSFNFELLLQYGKPGERYQQYLKNRLSAQIISSPHKIESLLKIHLVAAAKFHSPISLTKIEIKNSSSSFAEAGEVRRHPKVCNIFLMKEGDLNVASNFWNCRRLDIGYSNNFTLPKQEFLVDLNRSAQLLADIFPSMNELLITASLTQDDALAIATGLENTFSHINRVIFIKVFYKNFAFSFYSGSVYHSKPINTTKIISLDKSIRFEPITPTGHENTSFVFGYDVEIEWASGGKLSLPTTQLSAILLSNPIKSVEYSEDSSNSWSRDWNSLKTQPVRAASRGITGLAVTGEESRIYIPEGKDVLARLLKEAGFKFQLNDHTRYAQGFTKRFGGFEKTANLVYAGGTKIFVALSSVRAKQCGFVYQQISGFLEKQFHLSSQDAQNIVKQNLPPLLEAGLVYRGYPLRCPTCGLEDWYKLDSVKEFVECSGCAESFQLSSLDKIPFTYKPNALAARFLNSGGHAVLMTAIFLNQIMSYSGLIEFGGDLIRLDGKDKPREIDLFAITGEVLLLAECKSRPEINESVADEIIQHLERVVEAAELVKAEVVILGVAAGSVVFDLHDPVYNIALSAAERGIGVHLLLNDKFYLRGQESEEVTELWRLNVYSLIPENDHSERENSVFAGEPIQEYRMGEAVRLFNRELLEQWEQELFSE
jgi:Holliday junction resolvase